MMAGSAAGAMGMAVSGAPIKKRDVQSLLKPDKKATKKFAQRQKKK
jgi:hypothetical protein